MNTLQSTFEAKDDILVLQAKMSLDGRNFAAAETKGHLSVHDTRSRQVTRLFHGCDVTCLSWHQIEILTGGADGVIRLWDLRNKAQPVKRFIGHDYAVRKICSVANEFLSCSYDKTVAHWNLCETHRFRRLDHHTEFVYGLDLSPFHPRLAIDCSWDSTVKLLTF